VKSSNDPQKILVQSGVRISTKVGFNFWWTKVGFNWQKWPKRLNESTF